MMKKRMLKLESLVGILEEMAPLKLAESWDNVGLVVDSAVAEAEVARVVLTNDFTATQVHDVELQQSASDDAKHALVVSYHPPLFSAVRKLRRGDRAGAMALRCAAAKVAVFSPHTSWDAMRDGVNDWLLDFAGPSAWASVAPLVANKEDASIGMGRLGQLASPTSLRELLRSLRRHLNVPYVRIALPAKLRPETALIHSVAVCAGAGAEVLAGADAQLWITGEMRHHDLLEAVHRGKAVVLTEHSNCERGFLPVFADRLRARLAQDNVELDISVSSSDSDPLRLFLEDLVE